MRRRREGLGRQIVGRTLLATSTSVLMAAAGSYIFYGLLLTYEPHYFLEHDPWRPEWIEVGAMGAICSIAVLASGLVALGFARRLVVPLNAVAAGARRIAAGNLSARARVSRYDMGEASRLVENFNVMAERLEAASSEISRWNSVIAHELRTPVTILHGRLQGLADGVFEPDPALFRNLLSQVDGLARLIEDLRTVSLVESGHLDCRPAPVALNEEISALLELLRPDLLAEGFPLEARLDAGIVEADAGRVRQALLALIENARRHAPPGLIRIAMALDADMVRITVADSGPGLPPDFVDQAFKPFRRADKTRKGSGLGLAVVRGIAQAHGGTARYVSDPARFEILFPRR
ncbi:MAG: sensor histidine kinase [Stutzerimonas stutzeri]|nr:MAG: sensor histidine kinase [Stutzerimonas stutzeri]